MCDKVDGADNSDSDGLMRKTGEHVRVLNQSFNPASGLIHCYDRRTDGRQWPAVMHRELGSRSSLMI